MVIYDKNQLTFNIVFTMILLLSLVLNILYATNFSKVSTRLDKIEENQDFNFIQGSHNEIEYQLTEHGFLIRSSDDYGNFSGPSMQPVIFDGNVLIEQKYEQGMQLSEGMVVRFERSPDEYVIHRIRAIYNDGTVFVQGDSLKEGERIRTSQITHIVVGVLFT